MESEDRAQIERLRLALRAISQLLSYGVNTARHVQAKQIADAAIEQISKCDSHTTEE